MSSAVMYNVAGPMFALVKLYSMSMLPSVSFVYGEDDVVAQALGIVRIVHIVRESLTVAVEAIQPAMGSEPECSRAILVDTSHVVVTQTPWILRIGQEARELGVAMGVAGA